ncbi:MAG: VIT1/CCC1 transporter family protein [Myxococcota bacterium]|nr:VIT1/CCC1 transporter family protein [Myxococcota bacterium]
MPTAADLKRYRANLQDEIDSAAVYRAMAAAEPDQHLATVYRRLADVEERHAVIWESHLTKAGISVGPRRVSLRSRVLVGLGQCLGARFLLPTMANMENVSRHSYDGQPDATKNMRSQERSHARLLKLIGGNTGVEGSTLARMEGRHRVVGGNALRAAVLGANDGLVSNLSLVMGVAGAALSERAVMVTGLSGLLAGACSMAMGEWISVQSSRELYERQVAVEKSEIVAMPDEEEEELALIYMAKGLPENEAKRVAQRIMSDDKSALDAMTREELGIDPDALGGSPWAAAGSSFLLFAIGAVVPVLPFAFMHGPRVVAASLAASAVALVLIGFGITLFTGRSMIYTGVRQLLFGLGAAGVTFAIGHALGVTMLP